MVFVKRKLIKGKVYRYASKSIRLPGGKIVTVEKFLRKGIDVTDPDVAKFLSRKELHAFVSHALGRYKTSPVFDRRQIGKVEEMRLAYNNIIRKLNRKQLQDLFDRFTVNFTYESNALEGNSLTLKDVAIIIEENIVPRGKDLREVYDTRNSRKVVDLILRKRFKVSEKDIVRMHSMLVRDMGISTGYKKIPNFLVGRNVKTTPPELVERYMKDLVLWINGNEGRMHPLRLAAHAHGKFERIHPFEDGNGRVGRFLINVILANGGYPPLIIRKTQRIAYLKALEDYDRGYAANLERFILARYKDTFKKFFEVYVRYL